MAITPHAPSHKTVARTGVGTRGINDDSNANPDDPEFSCSSSNCDYQFRTDDLPAGPIIISVEMPDGRVYEAGLTLRP